MQSEGAAVSVPLSSPAVPPGSPESPWPSAHFAPARVDIERRPDGALVLRSPLPLNAGPRSLGGLLDRWADEASDRPFLAQRAGARPGEDWRILTYGEAQRRTRAVAQALLDRGLSPQRPILILAENGIDHAVMMLAATYVGIPVAPVSTAYARLSRDFAKLRYIAEFVAPQLVFVDDPRAYAAALEAVSFGGAETVVAAGPAAGPAGTPFAALCATAPTEAVARANAAVGPDTIAKILFTSGSTDLPKGVINTQRMLCSNQESTAQIWPFLEREPPVIVDWLPWNHTFGGNYNFNLVLRNGGTLFIDEGRPVPALFARSVANLKAVAPTAYFNVPRGYACLLDALEADPAFNRHFFSRLKIIFYAAAALPQPLWQRLEACSRLARGHVVPMLSGWGMTETAPCVTGGHFEADRAGIIGLPLPGCELMLAPSGERLEMRVRGPNVTPGYWRRPDLTAAAFVDGWFKTGDAARFADPQVPAKGILFDGRVAENFKLSTGTWVNVGMLRIAVLAAAAPFLDDAVVTGHDCDAIGLLAFPNLAACRALAADLAADAPAEAVVAHPAVRAALAAALARHNRVAPASSTAVARLMFTLEPPSIDASEITDKGYLNQRAVLLRRVGQVERLHADPPDAAVIVPAQAG
ncbi:feruloyl-CoA synthase [Chelatococcus reniformis]|uniref:Feruloyl-CoA synthase n=1 Tax=Chelatococcus reniformis TaxID=1494448 RepID=A0A916X7Y3_9HYPH|nr:feruloyl-CoA synthase [Chelatococcus reniformis]GGC49196.1 feruloyl-CoA synthase [Chelatococcus reniformis]